MNIEIKLLKHCSNTTHRAIKMSLVDAKSEMYNDLLLT